jgi:hypothetical protein
MEYQKAYHVWPWIMSKPSARTVRPVTKALTTTVPIVIIIIIIINSSFSQRNPHNCVDCRVFFGKNGHIMISFAIPLPDKPLQALNYLSFLVALLKTVLRSAELTLVLDVEVRYGSVLFGAAMCRHPSPQYHMKSNDR